MVCDCFGYVDTAVSFRRATKPKVNIFEIRFQSLIQVSYSFKKFFFNYHCGKRYKLDGPLRVPNWTIGPSLAASPSTTAPADGVETSIYDLPPGGLQ